MPDGVEKGPKAEQQPKPKDAWDKTDILGKLLGSILIPIGLAFAGFKVNSALQDRAAQQQTAQIAITVLQAKEASLPALRTWAKGVFIQMLADANNPLSAEAEKELQTTPLPSADDSSLPTACPFDATKVSGKELAERFEGTPIGDEEFAALEETIKSNVGQHLSDKQAQALADLAFNVGTRNLMASSIVAALKSGDTKRASEAILSWNKFNGRSNPGLHARRLCDRDLFLSG